MHFPEGLHFRKLALAAGHYVSKILGLCRDFDKHLCRFYTRLFYSYPNTLISNGLAGLTACTSPGIAIAIKTFERHDGKDVLQVAAQKDLDGS
jgi:hypothetical protein